MAKRKPLSTAKPAETCVLIGLATRHQRREQLEEYLEEVVSFFVDAKKFAAFEKSCVIPVLGAVADDEALTSPN